MAVLSKIIIASAVCGLGVSALKMEPQKAPKVLIDLDTERLIAAVEKTAADNGWSPMVPKKHSPEEYETCLWKLLSDRMKEGTTKFEDAVKEILEYWGPSKEAFWNTLDLAEFNDLREKSFPKVIKGDARKVSEEQDELLKRWKETHKSGWNQFMKDTLLRQYAAEWYSVAGLQDINATMDSRSNGADVNDLGKARSASEIKVEKKNGSDWKSKHAAQLEKEKKAKKAELEKKNAELERKKAELEKKKQTEAEIQKLLEKMYGADWEWEFDWLFDDDLGMKTGDWREIDLDKLKKKAQQTQPQTDRSFLKEVRGEGNSMPKHAVHWFSKFIDWTTEVKAQKFAYLEKANGKYQLYEQNITQSGSANGKSGGDVCDLTEDLQKAVTSVFNILESPDKVAKLYLSEDEFGTDKSPEFSKFVGELKLKNCEVIWVQSTKC